MCEEECASAHTSPVSEKSRLATLHVHPSTHRAAPARPCQCCLGHPSFLSHTGQRLLRMAMPRDIPISLREPGRRRRWPLGRDQRKGFAVAKSFSVDLRRFNRSHGSPSRQRTGSAHVRHCHRSRQNTPLLSYELQRIPRGRVPSPCVMLHHPHGDPRTAHDHEQSMQTASAGRRVSYWRWRGHLSGAAFHGEQ